MSGQNQEPDRPETGSRQKEPTLEELLEASGFKGDRFTVVDSLPENSGERKDLLKDLAGRTEPLIFRLDYEALSKFLAGMIPALGPRPVLFCQDSGKDRPGMVRTDMSDLEDRVREGPLSGRITLVLAGAGQISEPKEEPERQGMQATSATQTSRSLTLTNSRGLHARSATRIIQVLQGYSCRVWFAKDDQVVEGDSILSLLTLNCPRGSQVDVRAEGAEADKCLEELGLLFARNFDED